MLNRLIELLDGIGMARRTQVILAGGLGLALLWGVYSWAAAPSWVPAFRDLDLQDAARLNARLEEQGIPTRWERGGSEIQVPADQLVEARIQLADDMPNAGRPGFEIFDGQSWGMTDFVQRVNYRRALEGELERTIEGMAGVESAKVHLAIQEMSAFRRAGDRSEASVVLTLRRGMEATGSMVRGITYLIASSVDRITSEHVTVVDGAGTVLSASYESDSGAALNARQLELQRDVERHLEAKAGPLLDRVVGRGNAVVRVAAALNMDQLERTTAAVDPEASAIVQEDRAEIIPQEGSTGAASAQTSTSFQSTQSIEQFAQRPGSIDRLTVSVLLNGRPVDNNGTVTFEALAAAELQQIEQMVRGAVGFNATRGDDISVVNIPFTTDPALVIPPPGIVQRVLEWIQVLQKPVLALIALILGFLVAMRLVRTVRETPAPQPRLSTSPSSGPLNPSGGREQVGGGAQALPQPLGGREARERIAARVVEDPGTAARAAGAWLKEA